MLASEIQGKCSFFADSQSNNQLIQLLIWFDYYNLHFVLDLNIY